MEAEVGVLWELGTRVVEKLGDYVGAGSEEEECQKHEDSLSLHSE